MSCTISTNKYDAIIFDMDGVVTKTAAIHARAWKHTFDELLEYRFGAAFLPFDIKHDYDSYVDGKPRYEGVESFLESRDIKLKNGTADDAPGFDSVCAIGNLKNERFHELLKKDGVEPYKSTVNMIHSARQIGLKTSIITSSRNGRLILEKTKLDRWCPSCEMASSGQART
jgi:beta-phosphoglucomutase-like phosphatase (HAD superfamily)